VAVENNHPAALLSRHEYGQSILRISGFCQASQFHLQSRLSLLLPPEKATALSYEAWLICRNEDALKNVATEILVFDFEFFMGGLFTSISYNIGP